MYGPCAQGGRDMRRGSAALQQRGERLPSAEPCRRGKCACPCPAATCGGAVRGSELHALDPCLVLAMSLQRLLKPPTYCTDPPDPPMRPSPAPKPRRPPRCSCTAARACWTMRSWRLLSAPLPPGVTAPPQRRQHARASERRRGVPGPTRAAGARRVRRDGGAYWLFWCALPPVRPEQWC